MHCHLQAKQMRQSLGSRDTECISLHRVLSFTLEPATTLNTNPEVCMSWRVHRLIHHTGVSTDRGTPAPTCSAYVLARASVASAFSRPDTPRLTVNTWPARSGLSFLMFSTLAPARQQRKKHGCECGKHSLQEQRVLQLGAGTVQSGLTEREQTKRFKEKMCSTF